jgi:hypothetical protein
VLPRGLATRAGAAPGIMLAGTTAGAWGASTGLGQAGAGNARLAAQGLSPPIGRSFTGPNVLPRPRKPGLELRPTG